MNHFKGKLLGAVLLFVLACVATASADERELLNLEDLPEIEPPVNGHLVIAGGGELPGGIRRKFMDLAGGVEETVLVIPTASQLYVHEDVCTHQQFLAPLFGVGARSVEILHADTREEADSDDFITKLDGVKGVWLSGGNQWDLSKRYAGTKTEKAFVILLDRGGVIGGTSAGAAIMCRKMIKRGDDPEEGRGFTFFTNIVVDQHFLKRNREDRLRRMLGRYPQYAGMGIDEQTAAVYSLERKSVVEVIGNSEVRVYIPMVDEQHRFETLTSGSSVKEMRW